MLPTELASVPILRYVNPIQIVRKEFYVWVSHVVSDFKSKTLYACHRSLQSSHASGKSEY
jgi:hypothetical protein